MNISDKGHPVDLYCDNDDYELKLIHPELLQSNSNKSISVKLTQAMDPAVPITFLPIGI